jgi:hypothetical protein
MVAVSREYMSLLSFSLFNNAASTQNYSLSICGTRGIIDYWILATWVDCPTIIIIIVIVVIVIIGKLALLEL